MWPRFNLLMVLDLNDLVEYFACVWFGIFCPSFSHLCFLFQPFLLCYPSLFFSRDFNSSFSVVLFKIALGLPFK